VHRRACRRRSNTYDIDDVHFYAQWLTSLVRRQPVAYGKALNLRWRFLAVCLGLASACAPRAARPSAAAAPAATPPAAVASAQPGADAGQTAAVAQAEAPENEDETEGDEAEDANAPDPEHEAHQVAEPGSSTAARYTADLSDAELETKWKSSLESLGSISLGFADEGRLINGAKFPDGDGWVVVSPEKTWATTETIAYVQAAIHRVRELHPNAPPLRVNQISGPEGGYLRPHHSHQNGRDADLAFYYPTVDPIRVRQREKYIDVALNWELVKALVTLGDVEFILVDRRVQKVLYDYALKAGEDPKWLDSLFHAGRDALLQHARGHRDHFHVRFYNARAQELGRRVAPLLAQRPDENRLIHRVHSGDTLGALAHRYGSSVAAIQKVNHLKTSFLRLSQVLQIPLRGPCTQCPIPVPVVVPPRRLPPASAVASIPAAPSPAAAAPSTPASADASIAQRTPPAHPTAVASGAAPGSPTTPLSAPSAPGAAQRADSAPPP
jgi:murein endopeptidase/LysM repeat protein